MNKTYNRLLDLVTSSERKDEGREDWHPKNRARWELDGAKITPRDGNSPRVKRERAKRREDPVGFAKDQESLKNQNAPRTRQIHKPLRGTWTKD